jgi:hypothetical protein
LIAIVLTARGKLLAVFGESRLKRIPRRQWFSREEAEKEKQACSNLAVHLNTPWYGPELLRLVNRVYSVDYDIFALPAEIKVRPTGTSVHIINRKTGYKSVTYDES